MKKAKMKVSALVLGIGILSAQATLATYSSYGTFEVSAGQLQAKTTAGSTLKQTKTSWTSYADFQASAMTMWTDPDARIVNSDLVKRSDWVEIKEVGSTYRALNNTGDGSGKYNYYAQVRGDAAQKGVDTITLRFNPY